MSQSSLDGKIPSREESIKDISKDEQNPPVRKRTRATPEQLAVLEDTFAMNVSPNSKLRKQLAERLQMSERSIQIWFQNRRAKTKLLQKRAQMQMQQASIRAQLYHYHQQQYGVRHPAYPPYYHHPQHHRMAIPRAQSVDTVSTYQNTPPPPSYYAQPPPPGFWPAPVAPMSRQSMPPQACGGDQSMTDYPGLPQQPLVTFPPFLYGQMSPSPSPQHDFQTSVYSPASNSAIPTLVPVPDAGPTVMLTTTTTPAPNTPAPTPPKSTTESTRITAEAWSPPDLAQRAQSVCNPGAIPFEEEDEPSTRALSVPITTIDPTLTTNPPHPAQSPDESGLTATTLTIGTWHRLKLRSNDLLCVYRPNQRVFAWHIADNGCQFKMEIQLDAVVSIEYVAAEAEMMADLHFDMSEPPLFYMNNDTKGWVQCSDFTEGKQASRFFRHSLKGVSHHMKQELLEMMNAHEETRRLVRFMEPAMMQPDPMMAAAAYMNPASVSMYWNSTPSESAFNEPSTAFFT
ncbi:hypothetical protein DFQ28_009298 [Apophysomyces sp. BC1034]|nr:hypothetical protein DFQ30_004526 [Apophysomyces sp. BC1015]KAG0178285.1 hypothetical protein DFQ29_003664 [Apophysomyces sp. BC1021]KAG0185453.1 hypothetical protein DFQ28_009298 [Apophysomyces sp. BC1034]